MKIIAKRAKQPALSASGEQALILYEQWLHTEEDLTDATICNYLSDLRQFVAWCEYLWKQGREEDPAFAPVRVTTPTITGYRTYVQQVLQLKPNSVNRSLIRLKRYFAWVLSTGQVRYNPAKVVKLVGEEILPPRHLDNQEEQALVGAVTAMGSLQDRAIIILILRIGLRARELCMLTCAQVKPDKRSGTLCVSGKHNKYQEIPLNITARTALEICDPSLQKPSHDAIPLFLSQKKHTQLTERGLGYVIKKYTTKAKGPDLSPHGLCHRFCYRMATFVPLHRLAQLMEHDSLDTTLIYVQCTLV